jgi:hypothetical protein
MTDLAERELRLDQLLLDPNNYRFQDATDFVAADPARFHQESVQERASRRLRSEGLSALKESILTNGFLAFERIVVRPYSDGEDMFVVVEGNRRVAALRWIQEDHAAGASIPTEVENVLQAVPVIDLGADADDAVALALMGVRHVGGIRQWGGYQRAKLVAELRDTHDLEMADIASRLAMSAWEVNRRYRAYRALQQMERNEQFGDAAEPTMYPIFHEAVAQPKIREWLEWSEENSEFAATEALEQFYDLITPGEDDEGNEVGPKLPTREHVRDLKDILAVPEAKRALLDRTRTYGDALGLAKAEELARSWVGQVSEAVAALSAVSVLELSRLRSDEVEEIEKLQAVVTELLEARSKLQA